MIAEQKIIKVDDGTELRAEVRETGKKVWLIATHGIGEHLHRHNYLVDLFGHHFNIFQYDLRGHGHSGGKAAYVDRFDHYMTDLHQIILYLNKKYKMQKYILFGHSMGGLITCAYLQNYALREFYPDKVFVNAPPVGLDGMLGEIVRIIPKNVFQGILQLPFSVPVGGMVDLSMLSHNPHIKEEYLGDKLVHLKLHTRLLLEMVKCSKDVFSRPIKPHCAAFCTIGDADTVVGVKHVKEYFMLIEKGFVFKEFPGAYHEIHNEVEKYRKPYFDYLKKCLLTYDAPII